MSKGIIETIAGAALIAVGVFLEVVTFGAATPLTVFLISAGSGMVLSGIGTMLAKGPIQGFATSQKNPIAPWNVQYGRGRIGGTVVYVGSFGDNDKYLDLVMVLAAHPCKSVDELLFDQQRIQIGRNNSSFTPLQQDVNISSVSRTNSTVTCHLSADVPLLSEGDQMSMHDIHPVGDLFNGRFSVQNVVHGPGNQVRFDYIAGGPATTVTGSGKAKTVWADYGPKVYMETMLGDQFLGQTFNGMINGTPSDGDAGHLVQNSSNPWGATCSLLGKTAVFLRLHYNDTIFANGLPQISYHVSGKKDIYDPRTGLNDYTENAALCIADYLANQTFGFKATYHSEIPDAMLIAAANICDQAMTLASGGTEPRYTCNGGFQVSMKRGEILQNMLTSCAGRLTYIGGQFGIWPAAWGGVSIVIGAGGSPPVANEIMALSTGAIRWKSTVSISNRYNGVKGTYISPANNWVSADFPRYAQDATHGYTWGISPTFDANLDYDSGDRRWLDIQLPFTISCSMAQRIAKVELLRRLQMGTGTFLLNMAGYQLAPLDVLALDLPYFGWSGKNLEISQFRLKFDRQSGSGREVILLGTEIDVQETDSSIYSWSVGEELSPAGFQQAVSPDTRVPAPPTNVVVSGDHAGTVILSWTAPDDAYVLNGGHLEAQYQLIASPVGIWISLGKIDPTVTSIPIVGLTEGEQFIVRIRSVNAAGVPSQWVNAQGGPISIVPIGQWAPFQIQASSLDALFPDEWTFDLAQSYTILADGTSQAFANVTGKFPVTAFIKGSVAMALTPANVTVSPTGGSIKGGITLYLALGAEDANRNQVPPSKIVAVEIPSGTNTNSVTIGASQAFIIGLFAANVADGNMISIAGKIYTFQTTLTNVDGNVHIGPDLLTSIKNLVAAVNLGTGSGTAYAATTTANGNASAAVGSDSVSIVCAALTAGAAGNSLTCSGTAVFSNLGTFSGGTDIVWSATAGLVQYTVFASDQPDLLCEQATGALTTSSPPDNYTPGSIVFNGPVQRTTWALPDDTLAAVQLQYKPLKHAGVEGAPITGVSSPPSNQIVAANCVDVAGTDDWTGRYLIFMGRNNSAAPFVSYLITAFDPATGTFTLDRVASDVTLGDVFAVSFKGYDNSGSNTIFTDAGMSNAQNIDQISGVPDPHSGLNVNFEKGLIARIVRGFNRGATAKVVANSPTSYTFDQPLLMDTTSILFIEGPTWFPFPVSPIGANPDRNTVTTVTIPTINYLNTTLLIAGFTVDDQGNLSSEPNGPLRALYIYGRGWNQRVVTSDTEVLIGDRSIGCDTTAGPINIQLLPSAEMAGQILFIQKISSDSNTVNILPFAGETINGAGSVVLTNQWDVSEIVSNG